MKKIGHKRSYYRALSIFLLSAFVFPLQTRAQLATLSASNLNYTVENDSWDTVTVTVNTLLSINAGLRMYMNPANSEMSDSVEIELLSFYGADLAQVNLSLNTVVNLNVNASVLGRGDLIFRIKSKVRATHTNVKLDIQLTDIVGVLLPSAPLELNLTLLAPAVIPLPVRLLYFQAEIDENQVNLNWQTATETNNAYFTIEKSSDAFHFYPIAQIDGAGNSASLHTYSYSDMNIVQDEILYYRLKQTDFNGAFEYFQPVAVHCAASQINDYMLYPNPATELIHIEFSDGLVSKGVFAEIYNTMGVLVSYMPIGLSINVSDLSPGVYFIKLTDNARWYPVKKIEKR